MLAKAGGDQVEEVARLLVVALWTLIEGLSSLLPKAGKDTLDLQLSLFPCEHVSHRGGRWRSTTDGGPPTAGSQVPSAWKRGIVRRIMG